MGYNVNRIKKRAEELAEGYQDARDEEFHVQFQDMFMKNIKTDSGSDFVIKDTLTEDDLQGFIDSFDFPDENDWAFDAVQSELDDIGDQKYEQMRDERLEKENE